MKQSNNKFSRPLAEWLFLIFMMIFSILFFCLGYVSKTGDQDVSQTFMIIGWALFLFGFYGLFFRPYEVELQNEHILIIKGIIFRKVINIPEIQMICITDAMGWKTVYNIILVDGKSVKFPRMVYMKRFLKEIVLINSNIEIKDVRRFKEGI